MLKVKYNFDGFIEKYKARLIAQKFSQIHGINYMEIFIPTIRSKLLRIFLAITRILGIILI